MRFWKLALGVAIVLAIAVWDLGLPSQYSQKPTQPTASPAPPSPSQEPWALLHPGNLQPKGTPTFSAVFDGDHLDTKVWGTCYPWQTPPSCTNFGNKEYEWYLPAQDEVYNGVLHLVAQREPTVGETRQGGRKLYSCRSGIVTTYPGFRFKYGFVQIVAEIPQRPGLWQALWLAAANLHWPPEIDILEGWGSGFSAAFFHPLGAPEVRGLIPPQLAFGWHIFSLSWTKTRLTWFVDGKAVLTVRAHVPQQAMYFLADLAEYGYPKLPSQCTGSLLIRSVKVWSR